MGTGYIYSRIICRLWDVETIDQ